jgi:hypothetical protein
MCVCVCVCRCLEFDEQPPVEYSKQLVLSCLLHCCQKLSHDSTSVDTVVKQAFNVESVVHCIRASQNPHTHHHALLLLAYVAGMMPVSLCLSVAVGSRISSDSSPVPIVWWPATVIMQYFTTMYIGNFCKSNLSVNFTYWSVAIWLCHDVLCV